MAVLGQSRSGPPPPDQILDPPLKHYRFIVTGLKHCTHVYSREEIVGWE